MTFPDRSPWTGRDREAGTSKNINQQEMNRWAWRRLKVCYVCIKVYLFPPRIELGTFCVLGRRDNRYTTETSSASTPLESARKTITQTIAWNIQTREQNFLSVFVCMFGFHCLSLSLSLFYVDFLARNRGLASGSGAPLGLCKRKEVMITYYLLQCCLCSSIGFVAQWITRLPTEQKIPGSTPGRLASF